jgi:hypothetical protein
MKVTLGVDRLRLQLGVDFLFIIAYASMLASYCVAAGRLFWRRREDSICRHQAKLADAKTKSPGITNNKAQLEKVPWQAKLFSGIAVAGFAFAGLQWLAAVADGAWRKSTRLGRFSIWLQPTLRIVFAGFSFLFFWVAKDALFVCRPHPEKCPPKLLFE